MKLRIAGCCVVVLLLFASSLVAHTFTSYKSQIIDNTVLLSDSRGQLITKCLNNLVESIADDEKDRVYTLKEHALSLEDSVYLPILPEELQLIDLYLNRFDDFLNDAVAMDSAREAANRQKYIFKSYLYSTIKQKVIDNLDDIKANAQNGSRLNQMDKDFIELYVNKLAPKSRKLINSINKESDRFLKNNPDSRYDYFVRRNIAFKLGRNYEGMFVDVSVGPGLCVLSGGLADWFDNLKGAMQADVSVGVSRYELSFQFVGVVNNTAKQDITFSNGSVMEKGEKWNDETYQFCIGRTSRLRKNWFFIPRIGVGYTKLSVPNDHENEENPLNGQKLKSVMPCIGAEIKYEKVFQDGWETIYFGPVLRLSVQPIRTKIEGHATYGAMTSLSLVFKFGLCEPKRIY